MPLISYGLVAAAVLVALPVALFFVEVVAALVRPGREPPISPTGVARQRVAVLVPAHNEGFALLPTLADIQEQLLSGDRLVVVADNCSDDTTAVARTAGVEVVERNDPGRRGKGYALAYGLDYLSADKPDIVIVIDADCRLAANTIDQLAIACASRHAPVQALDLMIAPADAPANIKVAEFAWRVKNWVRPRGLMVLGLPCQLMGTGMAFPWDLICSVSLANGSIVEDLKLGHDFALAGHPPVFCPSAKVTSVFPSSAEGAQSQRARWEQGHIGLIVETAPRLFFKAIAGRNLGLLALALDLSVPPLSLLAMLVIAFSVVSAIATMLGLSSAAASISALSAACFAGGVVLSWLICGRDILPLSSIWSVGRYVAGKLGLYGAIFSRKPGPQWIRTDRRRP